MPFSWRLGRTYSPTTEFYLVDGTGKERPLIVFPDFSTEGDPRLPGTTGDWHHYAVTFDGATFRGYYDGKPLGTDTGGSLGAPIGTATTEGLDGFSGSLKLGGSYLCIGCWNFGSSPEFYDDDHHPNNAWVSGGIDDVRIYNRVLSPAEIARLANRPIGQVETGPD